jgi:hypothetical protein
MRSLFADPTSKGLGDLPEKLGDCGLKRAFHDALGIRKIVFTFCDDVLTSVYKLESTWALFEIELLALFRVLRVDPKRVIRCLLAEMVSRVHLELF